MTEANGEGQAVLRSRSVAVAGGELVLHEIGSGPPVVFLHGWTLDHRQWLPQSALANGWRIILPDRRGCGASSAPSDLSAEAEDVLAMVGDGPFALVGLSQGGAVALDVARRFPDRVAALVLAGAPLHGVVPLPDGEEEDVPRRLYAGYVGLGQVDAMKQAWSNHPFTQVAAPMRQLVADMISAYDGRDLLNPPSPLQFSAGDVEGLPMPVMALAGEQDGPWRQSVAAFIGSHAPRGMAAFVRDAGHLCNLDQPAMFNRLVTAFFEEHFQ